MTVTCAYCTREAKLVTGKAIYPHRPDLYGKSFYECLPCKAYVGCHPGTKTPLGRLANAELRKAKSAAHAAFDPLWRGGSLSRKGAYAWLTEALGIAAQDCHIGMFDVETCKRTVEVCRERANA